MGNDHLSISCLPVAEPFGQVETVRYVADRYFHQTAGCRQYSFASQPALHVEQAHVADQASFRIFDSEYVVGGVGVNFQAARFVRRSASRLLFRQGSEHRFRAARTTLFYAVAAQYHLGQEAGFVAQGGISCERVQKRTW